MPKVSVEFSRKLKQEKLEPMFDDFISALKKLNDGGYAHPDLAIGPYHMSPQNMRITMDGVRLIDLDSGLYPYKKKSDEEGNKYNIYAHGKDQWIYVYNYALAPKSKDWRQKLNNWYRENEGKALSDNPKMLLHFYKNANLALPKALVNELHKINANEGVVEYQLGAKNDRKHRYEVSAKDFKSVAYKEEYKEIKGDALKRAILKQLKDSLDEVKTPEELKEIKANFLKSPERKVLDTAQGRTTRLLSVFGLKTDSRRAADEMFEEAKGRIKSSLSLS